MKNPYLLILLLLLGCFQLFSQSRPPTVKLHSHEGQSITYPQQALLQAEAGLVICRIFLDSNQQYLHHKIVYTSSEVLAQGVHAELPQLQFVLSQSTKHRFHFLLPLIFDLDDASQKTRASEDLLADAKASLDYGFPELVLRYTSPLLKRKKCEPTQRLVAHDYRADAYLKQKAWLNARTEVSNMIGICKKISGNDTYKLENLYTERMLLSLLSDQAQLAISDIFWLEKQTSHQITFLSHFLEKMKLNPVQAVGLAQKAQQLSSITPAKAHFWLEATASLAYLKGQAYQQAEALFIRLQNEVKHPHEKASILCQKAWLKYLKSKPAEALAHLQDAVEYDPMIAEAHYYRALCLERLSYHEEAIESLEQALILGLRPQRQVQGEMMMTVLASSANR